MTKHTNNSPLDISTWKEWKLWYSSLKPKTSPIHISENIDLVHCKNIGWGLYAVNDIITKADHRILPDELFGIVEELTTSIEKKSKQIGFDSEITIHDKTYVMYGILSLVNHQCTHQLRFKNPHPASSKKVCASNFGKKLIIKKGQEIVVRYCNKRGLWFPCSCIKCAKNQNTPSARKMNSCRK